MSKRVRPNLTIETLEDRSLPATWGVPWADPGHLTLSFTPTGTDTPTGPSTLNAMLAQAGGTAAKLEILRAFQTWAANANINIGLVDDGGQALGTRGAVQGDDRFGDIRIAAAPTGDGDELATASPYSWSGTTLSGDVNFGSGNKFQIGSAAGGYDLFTVAAHEAGHVFGLDHSAAPGSVMNETYSYKTGLSAGDVANIQALYGARQPDAFDAAKSNDTLATASTLPRSPGLLTQFSGTGDITSNSDVDFYKVNVPLLGLVTTIRLHAEGLSLLTSAVTVYDARGNVVATSATTDPLNNDLQFTFLTPLPSTYYVKVAGATKDVFGVGSYQLVVDTLLSKLLPLGPLPQLLPNIDLHTNDTLGRATTLTTEAHGDARFDVLYNGMIEDGADTDVYKVKAGSFPAGSPVNLNVVVWGSDANPLDPRVKVYDQAGNPVAFQILANDDGVMSVQVPNVTPGAYYYISVAGRTTTGAHRTGNYVLAADFNQDTLTAYHSLAGGTLSPATTTVTDTLSVAQAGVYQFALSADLMGAGSGAVTMTLTDAAGNVVLTMDAVAGQPAVTASTYLESGTYTVRYTYRVPSGTAAPVRYGLYLLDLDDPIGPMKPTSGGTTSGSTTSGYSYTSSSTTQSTSYGYSF